MIASTAPPFPEQTPSSFLEVCRADRQLARHRNAHFSSAALLSHDGTDSVVLGTTLGDIYTLSLSVLGSLGQQDLSSVSHASTQAHLKVLSLCNVSGNAAPETIASSGADSSIKLWRPAAPDASPSNSPLQEVAKIDVPSPSTEDLSQHRVPDANCLDAAPDMHLLRAGSNTGTVLTYDLGAAGSPAQQRSHSAHALAITSLRHHPTNPALFATSSADGTAAVWDARAAENGGCVMRVCPCAPVSGCAPASAAIVPTADAYRSFHRKAAAGAMPDAVDGCEYDQTGRWLALGCADGTLQYFSLLTQEVTGTLQLSSAPQALRRNGPDLFIGCAHGELYAGGFLAGDVSSFQEHVVAGRPQLTAVVAQKRAAGKAGMVVACGTPGTVLGMNSLLRIPLCTVRSRLRA
eukprot:jgi/Ulvmu1/886/UM100_0041.1